MLGRVLRLADYQLCAYGSGEEFLASLKAVRLDCAVLDLIKPGLSGFDVQDRMRTTNLLIPTVFITASDDHSLDQFALNLHAVALLRKPFPCNDILRALDSEGQETGRAGRSRANAHLSYPQLPPFIGVRSRATATSRGRVKTH